MISCNGCKKLFVRNHHNNKICSNECKIYILNLKSKNYRKNVILQRKGYEGYPMKKCIICSNEFKSITSTNINCSDECKLQRTRFMKNKNQKLKHKRDKKNPEYIIKRILRTCLGHQVERKLYKSHRYCNFTPDQFKKHIESKFDIGMNWNNWGLWHIDHIKPLSSFKLINKYRTENLEEILKANDLNNLQPLWARENLKKHAKEYYDSKSY